MDLCRVNGARRGQEQRFVQIFAGLRNGQREGMARLIRGDHGAVTDLRRRHSCWRGDGDQ